MYEEENLIYDLKRSMGFTALIFSELVKRSTVLNEEL
jgi:hypothetical protein